MYLSRVPYKPRYGVIQTWLTANTSPVHIADLLDFVLRFGKSKTAQPWGAWYLVIANLYMEIFKEQTIDFPPCKPKIWKRYIDNSFTILDQHKVDDFLQHLNSQQPSILFTMETKNNSKIASTLSLLIETLTGTHVGSRKLST